MIQYIRSRIGEDRYTALDMGREPDDHRREWKPPGLSEGKSRAPDDVSRYAAEPAPKHARMAEARAQWSNSAVTSESHFIPLTPNGKGASESGATKCDRGFSDTSEDEGTSQPVASGSSEYSPVSGAEGEPPSAEPKLQEVKTEDQAELLHMLL
jgi:hypothetical protein